MNRPCHRRYFRNAVISCLHLKPGCKQGEINAVHNCVVMDAKYIEALQSAREDELRRALRLLRRGEDPVRILDQLSRRLTNKLLHAPTRALQDAVLD